MALLTAPFPNNNTRWVGEAARQSFQDVMRLASETTRQQEKLSQDMQQIGANLQQSMLNRQKMQMAGQQAAHNQQIDYLKLAMDERYKQQQADASMLRAEAYADYMNRRPTTPATRSERPARPGETDPLDAVLGAPAPQEPVMPDTTGRGVSPSSPPPGTTSLFPSQASPSYEMTDAQIANDPAYMDAEIARLEAAQQPPVPTVGAGGVPVVRPQTSLPPLGSLILGGVQPAQLEPVQPEPPAESAPSSLDSLSQVQKETIRSQVASLLAGETNPSASKNYQEYRVKWLSKNPDAVKYLDDAANQVAADNARFKEAGEVRSYTLSQQRETTEREAKNKADVEADAKASEAYIAALSDAMKPELQEKLKTLAARFKETGRPFYTDFTQAAGQVIRNNQVDIDLAQLSAAIRSTREELDSLRAESLSEAEIQKRLSAGRITEDQAKVFRDNLSQEEVLQKRLQDFNQVLMLATQKNLQSVLTDVGGTATPPPAPPAAQRPGTSYIDLYMKR